MSRLSDLAADWPRLNELLDEALSLPPLDREGWLRSLPAEHGALKDTLARLLEVRSGIETGDFLGTLPKLDAAPGAIGALADAGAPQAGAEVGPYRLIRELGEGGMGSVWLAERADGQLKRQVALKLPRLTWARGLAERMARERDILATLAHPHIARLYDAGVDGLGRPWLALEHVQGRPIDVYARERGLTVRQRVELLLQVCEAVAYAHSRLVIHRDLKPGNILVTDGGQVRLLDFGIAKLADPVGGGVEAATLTRQGGAALTPAYASPEQLRGEALTTQSDVYSLGVVAYQLLAGVLPSRAARGSAAGFEATTARLEADPPSRSAAAAERAALRGDLDAIVLLALAPEPSRRHPTVQYLADELHRYLRGEKVRSRADTPWRWLRRLWRQHRLALAIGFAVALAALGGAHAQAAVMTALAVGAAVAIWQRQQALAQARRAEHERRRAEQVRDFLAGVFQGTDLNFGGNRDVTAGDLLRQASQRLSTQPQVEPDIAAELLLVMRNALQSLGHRVEGAAAAKRAAELARQGGADAFLRARIDAALAEELVSENRAEDASRVAQGVLDVADEADPRFAEARLVALQVLARVHFNEGELDAMAARLAESAALAERVLGPHDLHTLNAWVVSASFHGLGDQRAEELAAARRADQLARLQVPDGRNLQAVLARTQLALALSHSGQREAARSEIEAALALARNLIPSDTEPFAYLQMQRADILDAGGELVAARAAAAESVRITRITHDPEDPILAERVHNLGYYEALLREPAAATTLAEAVQRWTATVGPEHRHTRTARTYLAVALARLGDRAGAEAALPAPAEPDAWDRRHRAEVWWLLGDAERAGREIELLPPSDAVGLPAVREQRIRALVRAMTDPAGARPALERVAAEMRKWLPPSAPELTDLDAALNG